MVQLLELLEHSARMPLKQLAAAGVSMEEAARAVDAWERKTMTRPGREEREVRI